MPLETRLLDESFACEVVGLRLWEPQDDRIIDELRALWAHHPVLVFRRQTLSEDELAEFSTRFGPLERTVRTDWASPGWHFPYTARSRRPGRGLNRRPDPR